MKTFDQFKAEQEILDSHNPASVISVQEENAKGQVTYDRYAEAYAKEYPGWTGVVQVECCSTGLPQSLAISRGVVIYQADADLGGHVAVSMYVDSTLLPNEVPYE